MKLRGQRKARLAPNPQGDWQDDSSGLWLAHDPQKWKPVFCERPRATTMPERQSIETEAIVLERRIVATP
jgi:hypothetical protein